MNNNTIYLNIRKTQSYHGRCTFPGCENRTQLHDVPRRFRIKVMKQTKTYIANGAKACDQHLSEMLWNTVDRNNGQRYKFTTKQIEDLIQLLGDSGSMVTKNPG